MSLVSVNKITMLKVNSQYGASLPERNRFSIDQQTVFWLPGIYFYIVQYAVYLTLILIHSSKVFK
jgi:hypothetical protein